MAISSAVRVAWFSLTMRLCAALNALTLVVALVAHYWLSAVQAFLMATVCVVCVPLEHAAEDYGYGKGWHDAVEGRL
jgi:hypothetical protein